MIGCIIGINDEGILIINKDMEEIDKALTHVKLSKEPQNGRSREKTS